MIDFSHFKFLPPQGTTEWQKLRLGCFNASRISELMVSGKKKDETFGKTALAYINEVASERMLADEVLADEELFWMYSELVYSENKYMRFGSEHEHEARDIYAKRHGVEVAEVSAIRHSSIPFYSCSSDGIVEKTNSGIEIKCPLPKTYAEYIRTIHDNDSLKAVKPEYFWQIQSQIDICEFEYVDFVVYCPFMPKPIHEVRIVPDDEAIENIHNRIKLANELIESWNLLEL